MCSKGALKKCIVIYLVYLETLEQKLNRTEDLLTYVQGRVVYACRVCFQEREGSSQCQGNRDSCSGWSTDPDWTAHYRDDTDNRAGGCAYYWKIECLTGVYRPRFSFWSMIGHYKGSVSVVEHG